MSMTEDLAMESKLDTIGPVCCEKGQTKSTSRLPNPMLFGNISMLGKFLQMIVQDWKRDATSFQTQIDASTNGGEAMFIMSKAFLELQPLCLKCLFSYAFFFTSLEDAYLRFYAELNYLNRQLRVKHDSPPARGSFIEKVRTVRNYSIAHIGSNRKGVLNRHSAMSWQPMTLSKGTGEKWNLDDLTFGSMKWSVYDAHGKLIDQSDDIEITGVPKMDRLCSEYLGDYERLCSAYLEAVHARLPIKINNVRYYSFRQTDSGTCNAG